MIYFGVFKTIINFFLTEENNITKNIFSVDGALDNVKINFPLSGANGLVFNI